MQLTFEISQNLGAGTNPACAHFATNTAQIFYINNGKLYAISTDTPNGEWENRIFSAPVKATEDENITHMSLKNFPRYGLYGTWWSDDRHRFAIYEFEIIMSEYVEDGSISSRIDDPVVGLRLTLANPDEAFLGEDDGVLTPGSRIVTRFRAGDNEPYEMGTFYTSRSKYDVTSANAQVDALNLIGKALKDSSFDENNVYPVANKKAVLLAILKNAGIPENQIFIQDTASTFGVVFPNDMKFLEGIAEVLNTENGWKMHELPDGGIVVGSETFEKMPQPGKYTFYRDKDIFSRSISRDDAEAYSKVCVRSEVTGTGTGTVTASTLNVRPEPNTSKPPITSLPNGTQVEVLLETGNGWLRIKSGEITGYVSGQYVNWTKSTVASKIFAYADVPYYEGWGLARNKTLYVDAANGTTQAEIDAYAQQLAEKVSYSGIIESFTGPFRPHIQNGDEAEIVSESGTRLLGLITEVTHTFGKNGYKTKFSCDSGGIAKAGRMSDFISKISGKKSTSSVARLY